jgi:hypothetical protein
VAIAYISTLKLSCFLLESSVTVSDGVTMNIVTTTSQMGKGKEESNILAELLVYLARI